MKRLRDETGKELKKKYKSLNLKQEKLKIQIFNRLWNLSHQHVGVMLDETYDITTSNVLKKYSMLGQLSNERTIDYIITIEKYLADLHPHKQTKINFNESNS